MLRRFNLDQMGTMDQNKHLDHYFHLFAVILRTDSLVFFSSLLTGNKPAAHTYPSAGYNATLVDPAGPSIKKGELVGDTFILITSKEREGLLGIRK